MTYNHRVILRTVAVVLLFEGLFMLIPLVFALLCDESGAAKAFAITAAGCILIGGTIFKSVKYNTLKIKIRESYFIALSCWIEVCLVGTLPYLLSGGGYSYVDCFFESVSGWTTTGAWSININELPPLSGSLERHQQLAGRTRAAAAHHFCFPGAGRSGTENGSCRITGAGTGKNVGQIQ